MSRKKNNEEKMKKYVYIFSVTLFISIIVFLFLFTAYNKKLKETANKELSKLNKESNIVDNKEIEEFLETSFSNDKTINNKTNTISNNIKVNSINQKSDLNASNNTNSIKVDDTKKNDESINNVKNENIIEDEVLNFIAPVSGEIIKDFSVDTLVYSNTLKEWTTHNGIDIKADKTSIVVASESGTVESIKNDPRFGLTITIAHNNGFKTIYSNLLTTEFVKENEKVEKGQTIATVGESASFEVADEPHLHFEIYKDGECLNPTIYLKDA